MENMKQRPILFNTEMVQAILAGRKTQTRREVKISDHQPTSELVFLPSAYPHFQFKAGNMHWQVECPFGKKGDVLWVRETWFSTRFDCNELLACGVTSHIRYKADGNYDPKKDCVGRSWKPSIHMPKDAARIWLRIKDVRVERLQDISERDAMREGIESVDGGAHWKNYVQDDISSFVCPSHSFESLWHSINGADSWKANPWVWVLEFERIEKPN